jgi:hypothetical protein
MTLRSFKRSSVTNNINYKSILVGNDAYIPNSYESIATNTVGSGGVSSVTFSSIPATFTHLQIRATVRGGFAGTEEQFRVRFNGSTSGYASHWLEGDGSTTVSANTFGDSEILLRYVAAGGSAASIFGVLVLDILDYANTSKNTTTRTLMGYDKNGAGKVTLTSGLWNNTSAISSISIVPKDGSSWAEYSSFALYGIKGA